MFCMFQGARKVTLLLLIAAGVVCINIEKRPIPEFPHVKRILSRDPAPSKPYPYVNVIVSIVGYSENVVQRATGWQEFVNSIDKVAYYSNNFVTGLTPQNGDTDSFHFVIGCSKDLQTLTEHYEFNVNQSIPFGMNEECRIYHRTDAYDNVDVVSIVMGTPSTVYLELGRGDSKIHLEISQDFYYNDPDLPLPYKELLQTENRDSPFLVHSFSNSRSEEQLNQIVVTSEFSQPGVLPPYVTVKVQYGEEDLWLSSTFKCGGDLSLEALAENEWIHSHQYGGLDCYVISQVPNEHKSMVHYLDSTIFGVTFDFRPDVNDELIHLSINFYYDKEQYSRFVESGDELIDQPADDDNQPGAETKNSRDDDSGRETENGKDDNMSDEGEEAVLREISSSVANENLNKPVKLQSLETIEQQDDESGEQRRDAVTQPAEQSLQVQQRQETVTQSEESQQVQLTQPPQQPQLPQRKQAVPRQQEQQPEQLQQAQVLQEQQEQQKPKKSLTVRKPIVASKTDTARLEENQKTRTADSTAYKKAATNSKVTPPMKVKNVETTNAFAKSATSPMISSSLVLMIAFVTWV